MSPTGYDAVSILSSNTAHSGATRSIYPRGPELALDTFSSREFVLRDFVESLSEVPLVNKRRSGVANSQVFDPKPFIRSFEHALARLSTLGEQRQAHENELALTVRRAEGQHRQHCFTLQNKLDRLLESFSTLEARLDSSPEALGVNGSGQADGGDAALQIGARLDELDKQKRKADGAKFLISCWQSVDERGDLSQLEDLRRSGNEGRVRCAHIARQLLKISTGLQGQSDSGSNRGASISGSGLQNGHVRTVSRPHNTNELIERFLEGLENDMLEQFDDFRRLHDYEGMREGATALYDFNAGASVIGRFVNQHQFFLGRGQMTADEVADDGETWSRLANPDAYPFGLEPGLQALVDEVKLVLEEEAFIIKQIFPYHELVLIRFLQRIFQQSIQQRLEMVLEKASSVSTLAFLRTLQCARSHISTMVEDLKMHGLTEHPDTISPRAAAVLDQQLEELFTPYFAGSAYIERERRSLEELYASLLFKFTTYHSRRKKTPTSYLGALGQRGVQLLASARDSAIERLDSSDIPASQKSVLLGLAGLRDADNNDKNEIEVSESDGALSVVVVKRMMNWLAEAVGRVLELGAGAETSREVAALQKLLLANVGEIYLETGLDAANETASVQENTRTDPDFTFMTAFGDGITILRMTMTVAHSVLLPLTASNAPVARDMEKGVDAAVQRVEEKMSDILTHAVDAALNYAAKLLARQARTDYRPRDGDIGLDHFQTPTCSAVFAFVSGVREQMARTIEGKNAEIAFTELGMGFRTLLLEHFKKFQVNLAGGLMVSKDITKYIELLRSMPLAASFQPSLEVLVEIGNIFVIGPEALKDRLRGGSALTGIDKADLRPYIMRREDANSVGVQAVLNAL